MPFPEKYKTFIVALIEIWVFLVILAILVEAGIGLVPLVAIIIIVPFAYYILHSLKIERETKKQIDKLKHKAELKASGNEKGRELTPEKLEKKVLKYRKKSTSF